MSIAFYSNLVQKEIKNMYVHVLQEPQSYIQLHSAFTGWLYGKIIAFWYLGYLENGNYVGLLS